MRVRFLLLVAGLVLLPAHVVAAQPKDCRYDVRYCGSAGDSTLDIGGTSQSGGGEVSAAQPVSARSPRSLPEEVVEQALEPACGGNTPETAGGFCQAAAELCAVQEESAYWLFTRTRNTRTDEVGPWQRVQDPPYRCLRAEDAVVAQVPVEVQIAGLLSRRFASLPLPQARLDVRPAGRTLVNIATRFSTATTTQDLPPLTLLGRQVTVTAQADRYDWRFGDGQSLDDAGPGSAEEPIEHVYRRRGQVQASVRITWSGSFRVEGIAGTFDITGTATTDGQPADVDVRTAQAELVAQ